MGTLRALVKDTALRPRALSPILCLALHGLALRSNESEVCFWGFPVCFSTSGDQPSIMRVRGGLRF